MKKMMSIFLLTAAAASHGMAAAETKTDVQTFVKYADTCEHTAGEWDSDLSKKEKKRIQRAVIKYCGSAKAQSEALKKKYKDDPEVLKVISEHEYDSVTSFTK